MRISLIAAYGRNRELGIGGQLPWPRLANDMKRFRDLTLGKPVLMGRKTYESIGRALPDRLNIVLTGIQGFQAEDCQVAYSLEEVLEAASGAEELMVIGGSEVFRLFLPLSDRLYLTEVEGSFAADTFFPEINLTEWMRTEHIFHPKDKRNEYDCRFLVLERRPKGPNG